MHILGSLSTQQFLDEYWQRKPVVIRGAFEDFQPLLSAAELAGLSLEEEIESRIILEKDAAAKWHLRKGPFTEQDYDAMPKDRWTLLVQAVDHWLPEAADLLEYFHFIPSWRIDDLMISYATDGGSVGPHYDHYDVFLLQAEGQREWRLGQTCSNTTQLVADCDLSIVEDFRETERWLLNPGDMLYLPPKIAHWGVAMGECQTYSIGFRAPTISQLLDRVVDEVVPALDESHRYKDEALNLQESPAQINTHSVQTIRKLLFETLNDDLAIANALGRLMTEAKYADLAPEIVTIPEIVTTPETTDRDQWQLFLADIEALILSNDGKPIMKSEHARFSYYAQSTEKGSTTNFYFQGESVALEEQDINLVKLLANNRRYDPNELVDTVKSEAAKRLVLLLWSSELIYA